VVFIFVLDFSEKHVVCVIFIKSVLCNFLVVWYMGDKYEESYECQYYQKEEVSFYIVYKM